MDQPTFSELEFQGKKRKTRRETDALFEKGDPTGEDMTPAAMDVTHRFLMECMRLYPIVPMSIVHA